MGKEVRIVRTVYKKDQFNTVIDRDFKTYIEPEQPQDTDTVSEMFRLYDKLYYSIPAEGDVNSHEYLIKRSGELAQLESINEEIQPLLDEIAQLRAQLLDANQQIFELLKEDV